MIFVELGRLKQRRLAKEMRMGNMRETMWITTQAVGTSVYRGRMNMLIYEETTVR